ncbi:MAG: FAD-dependent oxidoreductase [Saprospiraceae bacterium]
MKRRDFLLKSTLGTTAFLLNSDKNETKTPLKKKPKSVIILGAGLAGLSAGLHLKKAGVEVTILEARKRVGGRVFSYNPKNTTGQVIEFGAEWVGESHTRIIELCKEFDLILEDNRFETDLILGGKYSKEGKWGFSDNMKTFWDNKVNEWNNKSDKEKAQLDKMDWWRFLSEKNIPLDDLFLRDLMDSTDFGESIRHTSAYAAFAEYAESSEKNEMDFKIKGGNGLLAEKMASAMGMEKILLDYTVTSVEQIKNKKVRVTCQNNISLEADRLICALPTRAVKKINWKPGFTNEMTEAMNALQYARIGKFPIVFSERIWERENFDLLTDTPAHYFYHGTKNQQGKTGVLMCYATGDKADVLASLSQNHRKELILEALRPAFGDVKKYVKEDLIYYWGKDEHSYGAYAFYGKNQWFPVMEALKKPLGMILFAGEHLADWQGFMEGAINSGEEAAEELILGH